MDIVREARELDQKTLVTGYSAHWRHAVSLLGLDEAKQKSMTDTLSQQLTNMLEDKTGRWLLNADHQQSEAELDIDYIDGNGALQKSIIDRTFVDAGTRWIIDYKSSQPLQSQSLEQFLTEQTSLYRSQLKRYATLFNKERPIRGLLYFPAIAASTEIPL